MANKITVGEMSDNLARLSSGALLRQLHILALDYAGKAETRAKARAKMVLNVRTGHLRASIAGRALKKKGYVAIKLSAGGGGDDVKYAKVHEQEGVPGTFFTIKAKNAPYLRFQYGKGATTPVGVARGGKTGAKWASVRQVQIPSRPFLKPSLDEVEAKLIPEVSSLLRGELTV